MGASSFTFIPVGDGAAVGWAITLVLTFGLIGLPTIHLLIMLLASDDDAFDRAVSDIEERVEVKRRAQGYAWGGAGVEEAAAWRPPQSLRKRQSRLEEDEDEVHTVDPVRRRRLGTLQPSR